MASYSFTDRVRKVLARACEEAFALKHDYVGTEHLLLGLMEDPDGVAMEVLRRAGVDRGDVRRRILESVRIGKSVLDAKEVKGLPYTSRAKKTLELSMAFARDLGHPYVGTEHLLLGIIGEQKGIGAQVLSALGLDGEEAERIVRDTLGVSALEPDEVPQALRRAASADPSVLLRWRTGRGGAPRPPIAIDDASSASIYEQIVAQVQEAVATGRLTEGERLPAVRRLADELDIAPGTVARAYSELERLGVVVTEGARGTSVAPRGKAVPTLPQRTETLIGLLRPVAVAAFHLGATADEVRASLEPAMAGIFPTGGAKQG